MKNSIGSLAALAAFAAPALIAVPVDPVAAAFGTNIALPTTSGTVFFDIDGDATNDFRVFSNGVVVTLAGSGSTLISASPVTFGNSFSPGGASVSQHTLISDDTPVFSTGYYGFSFTTGGATHAAWVSFDLSGETPLATAGGWQPAEMGSLIVGSPAPSSVPEPSAAAALAGATALLGAIALRRRRLPVAHADITPAA